MPRFANILSDFKNPVTLYLGVSVTIGYGTLFYSLAVFAPVISAEFNVGLDVFFGIFAIGLLIGGAFAPFIGKLVDRRGARSVMTIGSAAAALALGCLSLVPNLWTLAAAIILLEFAAAMVLYEAAFAGLAQLYGQNARRQITSITLIAGFASTIFWPLTQYLVEQVGWRETCVYFALINLLICLPLNYKALDPVNGNRKDGDRDNEHRPSESFLVGYARQRAIYIYSFAVCISGMVFAAFPVHMLLILQSESVSAQTAALVAMAVGPAQVIARIVEMTLQNRHSSLATGRVCFVALPLAIGFLLLPFGTIWTAISFAALYGVAQGLANIIRGNVPLELFGSQGYGSLVGKITGIRYALNAGAPFFFAYLVTNFDIETALIVSAALATISAAAFWLLQAPNKQRSMLNSADA